MAMRAKVKWLVAATKMTGDRWQWQVNLRHLLQTNKCASSNYDVIAEHESDAREETFSLSKQFFRCNCHNSPENAIIGTLDEGASKGE